MAAMKPIVFMTYSDKESRSTWAKAARRDGTRPMSPRESLRTPVPWLGFDFSIGVNPALRREPGFMPLFALPQILGFPII